MTVKQIFIKEDEQLLKAVKKQNKKTNFKEVFLIALVLTIITLAVGIIVFVTSYEEHGIIVMSLSPIWVSGAITWYVFDWMETIKKAAFKYLEESK